MQKSLDGAEKCGETLSWRSGGMMKKESGEGTVDFRNSNNHTRNVLEGVGVGGGGQNNSSAMNSNAALHYSNEDIRISKIVRRLMGESNPSMALDLCKKLRAAVFVPVNAHYICRSFEPLLDNMLSVLKHGPVECHELASRILGCMHYINRADFDIYKNYLFKAYDSTSRLQKYIMLSLKTTLSCDGINLELLPYSGGLFATLKDRLENAALPENFIAVSETIAQFSRNYHVEFQKHFTDIVDIVVGWHLEVDQTQKLKLHCSMVLQQFAPYFVKELEFTFGLLGQFLEDIAAFGEDIATESVSAEEQRHVEMRFGAFVGAFTTIVKSLAVKSELIVFTLPAGHNIVEQALHVVAQTAHQTLSLGMCGEETILNLNDFLCLVCVNYGSAMDMAVVEQLLSLQIDQLHHFNEQQQMSLLYLLLCIVRQQRDQKLFVALIFRGDDNPLQEIKLTQSERLYKLLLRIYREVLLTKNVALLQQAYTLLTDNFNAQLQRLHAATEQREIAALSTKLVFDLVAIAVLATQTSSLISMYALHQPILNFLATDKLNAVSSWRQKPMLHSALLGLVIVHCEKHRQFVASSYLLTGSIDSPTAYNLTNNMALLRHIFASARQTAMAVVSVRPALANLDMHLKWLRLLLEQCKDNAALLCQESGFLVDVLTELCVPALALQHPLEHAACMQAMLPYATWLPDTLLHACRALALQMLGSCEAPVQSVFAALLARLPLRISLALPAQQQQTVTDTRLQELHEWYKATPYNAPLRAKYFKPFLERMTVPSCVVGHSCEHPSLDQLLLDCFNRCWTVRQPSDRVDRTRELALAYQQTMRLSHKLLSSWQHLEAARYCVHNKLRTTLGKPQETFLAIEALVMKYSGLLSQSNNEHRSQDEKHCIVRQHRSRHLLGFLEQLEKCIYNAAEGSAFALFPAEKPAKNFFRINASTCSEWFKRISGGVYMIALHGMEPELVVRFAENMLRVEKLVDSRAEQTIMALVVALLNCGESDALRGLYVWLKSRTGKRYVWIQHAAEQAAGRRELAADGYLATLSQLDSEPHGGDGHLKEFLNAQLSECLYTTAQWTRLRELQKRQTQAATKELQSTLVLYAPHSDAHLLVMDAVCYGHNVEMSAERVKNALAELASWPDEDFPACRAKWSNTYSYHHIVRRMENACLAQLVNGARRTKKQSELLTSLRDSLLESLRHSATASRQNAQHTSLLLLNHVAEQLLPNANVAAVASAAAQVQVSYACSQTGQDSGVLLQCLQWALLFEQHRPPFQPAPADVPCTTLLYLDVAARARREGNAQLCSAMLRRFFVLHGFDDDEPPFLHAISARLQSDATVVDIGNAPLLRGYSELVQCLYATQPRDALQLGATICHQIVQQVEATTEVLYPVVSAQMLLIMSDWLLQRVSNSGSIHNTASMRRLLASLPEPPVHVSADISAIIPPTEQAIGRLIHGSIQQRSDCGDAWYSYGNWCYRWGKRAVEAKGQALHDRTAISKLLGAGTAEPVVETLLELLQRHQLGAHEEDGENVEDTIESLPQEQQDYNSATEQLERELRELDIAGEHVGEIVRIWRQGHRSVYAYYETAARAYFRYLAIETSDQSSAADCTYVTTTLRLLRLIVKHAIGLQEELEEGLRNTPLRPWKVIIPQLFSRLNHHEPYVRKSVSELLCRLSQQQPNLVIFPAVVGALQEHNRTTSTSTEGDTTPPSQQLSHSFGALLHTLAAQQPQEVRCVQLLVSELKRVTLLWEEYWLHALTQLYTDYSTLFSALELDARKAGGAYSKAAAAERRSSQYASVVGYLVADLERIASHTQRAPETRCERIFQEHYGDAIISTIADLKQQVASTESWLRFKQLYAIFQQRALRNTSSTLRIADLSGVLAHIGDQGIAMPGVDSSDVTTIQSVESNVYILPTKTRPKKLAFLGSDGRRYTYLFKGLEDLHLDERIMQFLAISNSMMARSSELVSAGHCYKAQHYSVIPLGPQSGLISWVDGVTPLFGIYKKWQQRDAAFKQQQKERQLAGTATANHLLAEQTAAVPSTATRPSELFYAKLTPLLAEQHLKISDPRKQWPLNTLRRVLDELCAETPRDLLAKELWCHALNAADWRKSVRSYSVSAAVMSVIGYVIGLGDRHLDNVLIKLSTGEMLHIDYNVCFEKGKTLRVPEKVPFRMTPNLEEALGITGIEGTFRLGCEHVLRTLRKERETLLTLLEAFVYDPLVDWTLSEDGTATTATVRTTSAHLASASIGPLNAVSSTGNAANAEPRAQLLNRQEEYAQRKQDWELVRQSISARFADVKPQWLKQKDELKIDLLKLADELERLAHNQQAISHTEHERDNLSKQLAMITELAACGSAIGSHALNTASQRYAAYKLDAQAFHDVKRTVQTYRDDNRQLLATYCERTIAPLASNELSSLKLKLQQRYYNESDPYFLSPLLAFASSTVITQPVHMLCDVAQRNLNINISDESDSAFECIDALLQYARVVQFQSRARIQRHRLVHYTRWYSQLLDDDYDAGAIRQDVEHYLTMEATLAGVQSDSAMLYAAGMREVHLKMKFTLQSAKREFDAALALPKPLDAQLVEAQPDVLLACLLGHLAQSNESFMLYEELATANADPDLLQQQIDHLAMLRNVSGYAGTVADYVPLQQLRTTLGAVRQLQNAFELSLLERLLQLYMLDDRPQLQACLELMCTPSAKSRELLQAARTVSTDEMDAGIEPEVAALLGDMACLFDTAEEELKELQRVSRSLLEPHAARVIDTRYKQCVEAKVFDKHLKFTIGRARYDVIAATFSAVRAQVSALLANDTQCIYDMRAMATPIVEYVSYLQNSFLGGLVALYGHAWHAEVAAQQGPVLAAGDNETLRDAQLHCQRLVKAWQHDALLEQYERQILRYQQELDHHKLVTSAHYWANEVQLASISLPTHIIAKEQLFSVVKAAGQSLSVWKQTLAETQTVLAERTFRLTEYICLRNAAREREILTVWDEIKTAQKERYDFYDDLITQLIEHCKALVSFEQLQSGSSDTYYADKQLFFTIQQWQETYASWRHSAVVITPAEQSIVQLLDPEGKIEPGWIANISGLLDEMTFTAQRKLATLEQEAVAMQDYLCVAGQQLQPQIDTQLRVDLRHLLKMILKLDKNSNNGNSNMNASIGMRTRDLQHTLRHYHAKLSELQIQLLSRDNSSPLLGAMRANISSLLDLSQANWKEMQHIMELLLSVPSTQPDASAAPSNKSNNNNSGNNQAATTAALEKKALQQPGEQKRNAYAVSVWKRIRMKLEGRDPDVNARTTVAEQVDFIIREATNPDNLAVLYEGWTPWV